MGLVQKSLGMSYEYYNYLFDVKANPSGLFGGGVVLV